MKQVVHVKGLFVNLSPDAFHMWAKHYYKCKQDFKSPDSFTPVPYFLLCRAIELEVKARHLLSKRQAEVKKEFGHDLLEAYEALDQAQRTLSTEEIGVLRTANEIYVGKGFEYFNPAHALRGYSEFPDLAELDAVASTLISW